MNIEDVCRICEGSFVQKGMNTQIQSLITDSRIAFKAEGALFFAIEGERHDGHDYIKPLIQKGVQNFIVSKTSAEFDHFNGVNIIQVQNVIEALHLLVIHHRSHFLNSVLAVTGSNGKTIVKEWLWQLLSPDRPVVKSPKSYNSQIGVPLSVWQLDNRYDLAIIEAGISQPGEMSKLERIIQPQIGIITNVNEAHLENFKSKEEIAYEKLKLFYHCETLIYCSDHQIIQKEIESNPKLKDKEKLSWSFTTSGQIQIQAFKKEGNNTVISLRYHGEQKNINVPFSDKASIENAMHCITAMLYFKYDFEAIQDRIKHLAAVSMRLEVRHGIENSLIVNDSYNNDLASLHIALDFLNQQRSHSKTILIISDIFQSGRKERELYQAVAELTKNKGIDLTIGIGQAISSNSDLFKKDDVFYPSTKELLRDIKSIPIRNSSILLKGSRLFEFEKISERLEAKAHETVLEVNLSAVVANFNYFKSKLKAGVKTMAMVKASSYGAGNFEIAGVLEYNKADYLAVAYADEGMLLKKAGITLPIMVMNPQTSAFDAMIRYHLEPEIYNLRTIELFLNELIQNQYFAENTQPYPIHLKLDTGMHRLGFEKDDLFAAIELIRRNSQYIKIQTVFSHLSAADDPSQDNFTAVQAERFDEMCTMLKEAFDYHFDRHLLNSSGIVRFPDYQYDMVRLGIGLFGISGVKDEKPVLQSVSCLKTVISQIKKVKSGERVGYGNSWILKQDTVIATIPIGYADGLNRKLGNGSWLVKIQGRRAPIIGNVCMDMCMIDIDGIDAKEGDEVVLFESPEEIVNMAKALGTIPYEILTGISSRVKRIFFEQ